MVQGYPQASCLSEGGWPSFGSPLSKDRRIVRLFAYDNRSYSLFEKKFVSGYPFMRIEREGGEIV